MRRSVPIAVICVITAAAAAVYARADGRTEAAGWEYRVLDLDAVRDADGSRRGGHPGLADGLNALARDGWELVAIDPERRDGGTTSGASGPVTWSAHSPAGYVFKRPR